jgi:hypothetical protein
MSVAMGVLLLVGYILGSARARRLVRREALFYAGTNILIVGITFGILAGIGISVITWLFGTSWLVLIGLGIFGLMSTTYLGYQPDPLDEFGKAEQVAVVASVSYIVVLIARPFSCSGVSRVSLYSLQGLTWLPITPSHLSSRLPIS